MTKRIFSFFLCFNSCRAEVKAVESAPPETATITVSPENGRASLRHSVNNFRQKSFKFLPFPDRFSRLRAPRKLFPARFRRFGFCSPEFVQDLKHRKRLPQPAGKTVVNPSNSVHLSLCRAREQTSRFSRPYRARCETACFYAPDNRLVLLR